MARKAKELSARAVAQLNRQGHHAVGGTAGLYLYVSDAGAKSWVLRVLVAGKRRHIGLGGFKDISLALARQKAQEHRIQIASGLDPLHEKVRRRELAAAAKLAAISFEDAARAYVDTHGDSWKNPKHRSQWINTLQTYAFPVIGRLNVADVNQAQVLAILEPIWKEKTETATRVRGRLETVLDWAAARGQRSGDNPARWKGHLDKLLPAPTKIKAVEHHRALSVALMPAFMANLQQQAGIAARALEFAILTAARSGEVRGATWAEIDLTNGIWTVPATRMKAGVEHRVPLSTHCMAVLRAMPRMAGTDLIFPAPRGKALSDMSLTAVLRRMECDAVPHGFRSTFRDWAGDHTSYARDLAEDALAHTLQNKVEAAYRRGDALERRRPMMQDWADVTLPHGSASPSSFAEIFADRTLGQPAPQTTRAS